MAVGKPMKRSAQAFFNLNKFSEGRESRGQRPPGLASLLPGKRLSGATSILLFLSLSCGLATSGLSATPKHPRHLASTPPMGWNDWAHYQCGFTAQTILSNARQLVKTGLAASGYNTVTIDDCWMMKHRNAKGNLQPNPQKFPHGIRPIVRAVHALGLKFGIYEDAGYATCGGFAGSGQPEGGGQAHFLQDARLFASWGVDYLKLDGCNVYVPPGTSREEAYRRAYAAEKAALDAVGRPVVFSESAPAYFMGSPRWYDVLSWVRRYGQLWREGSDIAIFRSKDPDRSRFSSVLWNYSYNLPLGRFQKPGNWDDADFIIGGDQGMSLAETRSQMALWAMMSAPLILSSNLATLSPGAIAILGNRAVIAVDQDPLGRMATLVRRTPALDVLFKRLSNGNDAVAVLNHSDAPIQLELRPSDFGFAAHSACRLEALNLWNGKRQSGISILVARVGPHDTAIWRIHPSGACGPPAHTGAIVMTTNPMLRRDRAIENYSHCLAAPGAVEACQGTAEEKWTVMAHGALRSSDGRCLDVVNGKPVMQACASNVGQYWHYTLMGNLISDSTRECLSAAGPDNGPQGLKMLPCGHNLPNQIWSLPN